MGRLVVGRLVRRSFRRRLREGISVREGFFVLLCISGGVSYTASNRYYDARFESGQRVLLLDHICNDQLFIF